MSLVAKNFSEVSLSGASEILSELCSAQKKLSETIVKSAQFWKFRLFFFFEKSAGSCLVACQNFSCVCHFATAAANVEFVGLVSDARTASIDHLAS